MPHHDSSARWQQVRPFRLTEQRIWPGCIEIDVEGEIDLAVSDQLRAAFEAVRADPCHVLLDLDACTFIDSSGLAVIVAAGRNLADRGRQLLLSGVQGQVRRILWVTGLTEDGLLIAPDENHAFPERGFEVTVRGGETVRLTRPGTAAA
jgi:anti-anti-sigma factor